MKKLRIVITSFLLLSLTVIIGVYGFNVYMENKVKEFLDRGLFSDEDVTYDSVDFSLFNRKIVIGNVLIHGEDGTIFIEKVHVYKYEDNLNAEIFFENIKGVQGKSREAYLKILDFFKKYGYEEVSLNFHIDTKTDKYKNIGHFKKLEIIVPSAFIANISLKLGNFDPDFWKSLELREIYTEEDIINIFSEIGALKLLEIELYFKDEGFKNRYMNKMKEESGKDINTIKDNMERFIENYENPQVKDFVRKLSFFLERGRIIKVKLTPKRPIKLQDIFLILTINHTKTQDPSDIFLHYFNLYTEVY